GGRRPGPEAGSTGPGGGKRRRYRGPMAEPGARRPPADPPDTGGRRRPGRPPDLAKRQAVIDATLQVLAEVGYGSLTIDAIAQRAGSNRELIYRVWDSKVALVRDVLFGTAADLVLPDCGSLEGDLRSWVAQHVDRMRDPAYLKGVPGLTVELLSDPVLFRDTHKRYIEPSEEGFRTILARARARGEIVAEPDPRVLTYVVSGTATGLAQNTRLSAAEVTDIVMKLLLGGLVPLPA
ncbi:MAG: Bacterial regulatory protein tetR family, partial [Acidimicrobiales bacterium]|nr:Bacterial regulatory protein tetR family [Acidimicrobiales bacterium]